MGSRWVVAHSLIHVIGGLSIKGEWDIHALLGRHVYQTFGQAN